MNAYEEKQARRRERLENRADRLSQEASAKIESGMSRLRSIPFGQPILTDHYSAKRDRNFRAKAVAAVDKGMELRQEAAEAARKAEAAGTGGISSDDPEAVAKLKEKLAGLEAGQEQMKAINAAWRKAGKPKADDDAAWAKVAATPGITADQISRVRADMARDYCHRAPFSYTLSNNNANIARIKDRIAYLERAATRVTKVAEVGNGITVIENAEMNRVQIKFPGKPSAEIRTKLKSYGFRWSPSEGAWQRHLNAGAAQLARDLAAKFNEGGNEP